MLISLEYPNCFLRISEPSAARKKLGEFLTFNPSPGRNETKLADFFVATELDDVAHLKTRLFLILARDWCDPGGVFPGVPWWFLWLANVNFEFLIIPDVIMYTPEN